MTDRRMLFGLALDPLTLPEVVDLAATAVDERRRLLVGVVNAAKISKLKADRVLRESLLTSDVLLADGQSVVWASRLLGRPLPERVAGIDLFEALLGLADERHLRIYLLGARPEVLARLEQVVADRWPGATIAGSCDGYFGEQEAAWIAEQIAGARPDLLFLGMPTPRKEIFLATYGDGLGVPVLHGVGGSFDVLAGITMRAPERWQRWGMEWAYRLLQEPRRMWRRYLVTNTTFLGLVAAERIHRTTPYPRPETTRQPIPHTTERPTHIERGTGT
jgi:N-acetylglucosaminyldiphosphoundecaprenol N-acetyl-beta-D-mannosaminyltransferase